MPITCDDCGKEANYKDMPKDEHWFRWMSEHSRGAAAVVAVPCEDGVISCVCLPCLQKRIDEMTEVTLPDNAELCGGTSATNAQLDDGELT